MCTAASSDLPPDEQPLLTANQPRSTAAAGVDATAAARSRSRGLPDSPRRPTQKARLAAWARRGRGIRQVDWCAAPAPDGHDPILRVAAIIGFLEDDGFLFEHRPIGGGQVEYLLLRDPVAIATALAEAEKPGTEPEQLRLAAPPPVSAIHEWDI